MHRRPPRHGSNLRQRDLIDAEITPSPAVRRAAAPQADLHQRRADARRGTPRRRKRHSPLGVCQRRALHDLRAVDVDRRDGRPLRGAGGHGPEGDAEGVLRAGGRRARPAGSGGPRAR